MAASTERVRRHRERKLRGLTPISGVEVNEQIVERLIAAGWIQAPPNVERIIVKRPAIVRALNAFLRDWARG